MNSNKAITEKNIPDDFIILYPGLYIEKEKALVEQWIADSKAIEERGTIDLQALIDGTLDKDTPGLAAKLIATEEMIRYNAGKYDPENAVLNVAEYAKKLGYEDIIAYPTFAASDDIICKPYPNEARDTLLVSDLNHNITCYIPIYPDDTLHCVINKRFFLDITPPQGSIYRTWAIQNEASIYNQKGQKVNDVVFRVSESVKILKEGKVLKMAGGQGGPPIPGWESPAWTNRPAHCYTDEDWVYIKKLWKQEKRQCDVPLYWENVNIGDEPTWTVDGPILEGIIPVKPYGMGIGGSRTMKKEMLDPDKFKTMIRDKETGIYILPNRADYIPVVPDEEQSGSGSAGGPPRTDEIVDVSNIHKSSVGGRSALYNFLGRDFAIRHIYNWMGDYGWLYNIRWSIMAPSALAAVGKTVPASPLSEHFIEKVPKLKGKVVSTHPLSNDLAIVKSWIYNKYVRNGEFIVELIWWIETIEGDIYQEGGATVKLPSKNVK